MDFTDLHLKTADSTNRAARELGQKGGSHGSGVMAETQTAGRGRLGRAWFSPPGVNLYCSYIVRPKIAVEHYPRLTLAAGVAIATCLHDYSHNDVGLKWPNDLFIGARKCGGILSETSTDSEGRLFAVIGIGINCNLSADDIPADLRDRATSLLIEGGKAIDRKRLYSQLRTALLATLEEFEQQGFSSVLKRWHKYDLFRGRQMAWQRPDGSRVEGENLGPAEDGSLLVRDAQGFVHRVLSGDVNLTDVYS
ncbi:biotin--[acetyl-CoA-carboxylase] ligase [Crocinitomicaceae bacterium]|nr:biotin--[acetyl-CoA-carboxylase] ligase [Crocinitomicaceae bacterium]